MKNPLKNEKASPWLILLFSFLAMVLLIYFLSWQYNRMAEEEVSSLEERVESNTARTAVKDFLEARVEKNEDRAKFLLTERAMDAFSKGEFALFGDLESFEILQADSLGENEFSFLVEVRHQSGLKDIELIKTVKVLGEYYIDSLQLPG